MTGLGDCVHFVLCLLLFFLVGYLVKGMKFCKTLPGQFNQQHIQGKINSRFVLFLLSLEHQAMTV